MDGRPTAARAATPAWAVAGASAFVCAGLNVERSHIAFGTRGRAPATRCLPVGLLAQQRLTKPVELGDHLLRRRAYCLTGPFAQLLQLPGYLELNMSGNLVVRQRSSSFFASRTAARRSLVAAWASRIISRHSLVAASSRSSSFTASSSLAGRVAVAPNLRPAVDLSALRWRRRTWPGPRQRPRRAVRPQLPFTDQPEGTGPHSAQPRRSQALCGHVTQQTRCCGDRDALGSSRLGRASGSRLDESDWTARRRWERR